MDRLLEEAALDLGATHLQTLRGIVLPYLRTSLLTAAVLVFFQSFETFNTTLFIRGGVTPEVNALGLVLISITVAAAVIYTLRKKASAA